MLQPLWDALEEMPWLYAVLVVGLLLPIGLIFYCCVGSSKASNMHVRLLTASVLFSYNIAWWILHAGFVVWLVVSQHTLWKCLWNFVSNKMVLLVCLLLNTDPLVAAAAAPRLKSANEAGFRICNLDTKTNVSTWFHAECRVVSIITSQKFLYYHRKQLVWWLPHHYLCFIPKQIVERGMYEIVKNYVDFTLCTLF